MQERQPARQLRGLRPQAAPLVFGKRALLQLDRPRMLAPELHRLSQAVENLRGLAELRRLLEDRPGALPVRVASASRPRRKSSSAVATPIAAHVPTRELSDCLGSGRLDA